MAVYCFCLFFQFSSVSSLVSCFHQVSISFQICCFIFEIYCERRKQRSKCVPIGYNVRLNRLPRKRGSSMPLCTLIYLTALSWVFHKHFRLNTIKTKIMTFPLKLTSAVHPSSVVLVVSQSQRHKSEHWSLTVLRGPVDYLDLFPFMKLQTRPSKLLQ